jgi:hypothetical protein
MKYPARPLSPDGWLRHLFASQAALDGGIVRRQIRDVERYFGSRAFLDEMKRRGFPVVENAGQFVIFCNNEPIRRVV